MFYVGQKVVCIKRGAWQSIDSPGFDDVPKYGETYTVAKVVTDSDGEWLELFEFAIESDGYVPLWDRMNFRPVVERKTDISVFTEILDRVNKQTRETIPLLPQ